MTDPAAADVTARLRAAGCVFAEEEAEHLLEAAAGDGARLEELVRRRVAGEPLETLVGWVDFCGLRIGVRPGVFVPRQRSALLVDTAARVAAPGPAPDPAPDPARVVRSAVESGQKTCVTDDTREGAGARVVVDLCCGAGALGLAVVTRLAEAGFTEAGAVELELHAADFDPVAVACARENLRGTAVPTGRATSAGLPGVRAFVHEGDLFDALPGRLRGWVDVLVASPPYVPTDRIALMPSEARDHEPWHTLDGGADGLDPARRIGGEAADWLAPDGIVAVETGPVQAPVLARGLEQDGFAVEVVTDEETGGAVVLGRRRN